MREGANNILRSYEYLLDSSDKLLIEKDKRIKWELIANKIKILYNKKNNTKANKAFIEIVEKCVNALTKGNENDHQIQLEFYEINDIVQQTI